MSLQEKIHAAFKDLVPVIRDACTSAVISGFQVAAARGQTFRADTVDLDAEGHVLADVLCGRFDPPAWLEPEHFYSEVNGKVYRQLQNGSKSIDAIHEKAQADGYESLGRYLNMLRDCVPSAGRANFFEACSKVRNLAQRRWVIEYLQNQIRLVAEGRVDAEAFRVRASSEDEPRDLDTIPSAEPSPGPESASL